MEQAHEPTVEAPRSGFRRKTRLAVLILCVLVLGYAAWRLLSLADEAIWMGSSVFDTIPFDRETWLSYDRDRDPQIRKRMYFDIRKNHLKPGMSRADVLKLLGKPIENKPAVLLYNLGPDSLNIDTNQLIIEFDKSGRVRCVDWIET